MIASYFWHKAVGVGKIWNPLPHRAELIADDAKGRAEQSRWKHLLVAAREPPTGSRQVPGLLAAWIPQEQPVLAARKAPARPGKHNRLFGAEDLQMKSVRHPEVERIKM